MDKKQNKIINDIKKFSGQIKNNFKVRKVFLFGSYANGTSNSDSDIDVGVVIDGLEKMDDIKVLSRLYEYTKNINTRIEPYCISYKEYRSPAKASIISDIIKSGIIIEEK